MVQRVAIIGAGVSGLTSIKCCLDEGLEPTCFERSDGIGGLWQFTEIPEEGRTTVYRSVITNTSKEMTCFSDFPFPDDWPNYLHHSMLLKYLRAYTEHFHLLDYIQFKTKVCSIRKHPDFAATGQWIVYTETDGQQASAIFDAVMVSSGRYAEINLPLESFPGIENFRGYYLHSYEYRDQKELEGKKVLVVGAGNTGGDIASEICRTAAKVFLSTRSGTWVISRIADDGWPLDLVFTTRLKSSIQGLLPGFIVTRMLPKKFNQWFNHENYGLVPLQSLWPSLTLNEELPSCILSGSIVVKPNVKRFTETSVIFEDGTVEEDIDVVIFATGYKAKFPFLEKSVQNICKSSISLYKCVFPPDLEKPTLAFIGYVGVTGSILPAAELQARWVTRVFNGSCKLPPVNKLMGEVDKRRKALFRKGFPCEKDSAKMNFVAYMDEVAACIGVKPNVPLLFFLDPKLALEILFGPCTAYQYRLTGPGKWEKARSMILTQWDRVLKPLKTRIIVSPPQHSSTAFWVKVLGMPTFLGVSFLIFKYSSPSWLPRIK
uniref:Flavin-containing monooxygenase n=2 Tax=Pogona vitticeps TaxID=103695 RepID=A0ABM5G9N1_9SAUR